MGDKEQEEKKKNGKRINLPCQITVRLDKHSFEFIEEIGVKEDKQVSVVVRDILSDYIKIKRGSV